MGLPHGATIPSRGGSPQHPALETESPFPSRDLRGLGPGTTNEVQFRFYPGKHASPKTMVWRGRVIRAH